MSILFWAVFAAGTAFFWWVEYQDAKWSNLFELATSGEANWWSRGKDGYYSLTKSLTYTGIYFGGVVAFLVLAMALDWPAGEFAPLICGLFLAAAGGAIWSRVSKNVEEFRRKRFEQIAILKAIKTGGIEAYTHKPFRYTHKGRYFYVAGPHFWDIRFETTASGQADPAEQAEAKACFDQVLTRIAAKDESQWFTKGRTN